MHSAATAIKVTPSKLKKNNNNNNNHMASPEKIESKAGTHPLPFTPYPNSLLQIVLP